MWGLIGWAFVRRRGTIAEHEPISAGGGQIWIAIGGIAVPLLVLTVLFVLGLKLLTDFPIHGMHGGVHAGMEQTMKPGDSNHRPSMVVGSSILERRSLAGVHHG